MKTTILVIAAVILISFLFVRESYQVIPSSRVPAPAEVSFRNLLAEVTGLPVDLIDIVRGYDFPGQIFNIVQRSNEDLISQIDKMFRQEAKAQLRVVKDKIIKGDITNTLKKLDEITMTEFLDEKVLQWLNPGESFLPNENKSILQKLIKDISQAQQSISPFPILPNSIALQVDRQMQILSDEIRDIKNLYIFEMAKLDNFIKYPKILTNLELAKTYMQRNTPRTLGEYVKPRFGTFPQVVDMLIREISDQDPNEDNTDKEDELTEKLITAMYE